MSNKIEINSKVITLAIRSTRSYHQNELVCKNIGTLIKADADRLPIVEYNGDRYYVGGVILPYSDELNEFIDKIGAKRALELFKNN